MRTRGGFRWGPGGGGGARRRGGGGGDLDALRGKRETEATASRLRHVRVRPFELYVGREDLLDLRSVLERDHVDDARAPAEDLRADPEKLASIIGPQPLVRPDLAPAREPEVCDAALHEAKVRPRSPHGRGDGQPDHEHTHDDRAARPRLLVPHQDQHAESEHAYDVRGALARSVGADPTDIEQQAALSSLANGEEDRGQHQREHQRNDELVHALTSVRPSRTRRPPRSRALRSPIKPFLAPRKGRT